VRTTNPAAQLLAVTLPIAAAATFGPTAARASDPEAIEVTVRGSTAGGYVSKISTETAPREPIDAVSLLAELPSVHVRRLGAAGSFASLSIRGSAGAQVGVMLAGIPLTSAADPSFDLGSLPLWPGASFRVYRGFAPASLGPTGYLGGVLAVEAPSPDLGQQTSWWAAAGSFGSQQLRIGDVRAVGPLRLGTGLFASRSDGDFTYEVADLRTGRLLPRVRENAGHLSVGGIEHAELERSWGSVGALVFADARRSGLPGPELRPARFAHLDATRIVAGVKANLHTGEVGAVHALAWGRRETSDFRDPVHELDQTHDVTTRSSIEGVGASLGWRGTPLPPITVELIVDGRAERLVPAAGDRSLSSVPAGRLAAGAGASIVWRASPALTITGSGRIDGRRDGATRSLGQDDGPPSVSADFLPSGSLGASYRIADAAVVSAHAGALGRPPSFQELYGNGATLLSNKNLQPESALSADVGVHGDVGDRHAALGYEVVTFVTSARDLIVFTPFGLATFHASNIDRALFGGAEISASFTARGLRTQISYTLLLTANQSADANQQGRPLPSRPQHDLAYDASYRFGPVRLRYGLDAIAGTTLDTTATVVLPSRIFHGIGASIDVPFLAGLRASVDIENLFDMRTRYVASPLLGAVAKPVSDFYGFPLPGRSAWITLRFARGSSP
jgi:vitamin B12 transporter